MFFVMLGWVIFYYVDFGQLKVCLQALFTLQNGWIGAQAGPLVVGYLPILIIGIVASTPLGGWIYGRVKAAKGIAWAECAYLVVVLGLCLAALVSQTYNPFIYFRF
nr:MBOAT family protein [bacterium]